MRIYFVGLLLFLFFGCQSSLEKNIVGKWQAYQVTLGGDDMKIDANEVQLHLTKDKKYSFKSTIGYKEAGHYILEQNILQTTDTIRSNTNPQHLLVEQAHPDSLIIKMAAIVKEGTEPKEQIIYMTRQ